MSETLHDLKRVAAEHGWDVSDYQLERWRQRDLLPTPERKGLGRGKGTVALYPDGTAHRLLSLLHIKNNVDRRLEFVGWYLWCAGHDVTDFVRQELEARFGVVEELLDEQLDDFESGGSENPIEQASELKLTAKLDGLRRRLGGRFPTIVRVYLEVLGGRFKGNWMDAAEGDFDILEEVFVRWQSTPEHLFDAESAIEFLTHSSDFLNPAHHRKAAQSVSDKELIQARDELRWAWRVAHTKYISRPLPLHPFFFMVWFMVRLGSPRTRQWIEGMYQDPGAQAMKAAFEAGELEELKPSTS